MAERQDRHAPPAKRYLENARIVAGLGAFLVVLSSLPGGDPTGNVSARFETLRRTAGENLAGRRLAGRAPAYDRAFFELIRGLPEVLPPGTRGVALYAPAIPTWGGAFLAVYELAPLPVVLAPSRVPPGWVAVAYPPNAAPPGLKPYRALPGAEVLLPAP